MFDVFDAYFGLPVEKVPSHLAPLAEQLNTLVGLVRARRAARLVLARLLQPDEWRSDGAQRDAEVAEARATLERLKHEIRVCLDALEEVL